MDIVMPATLRSSVLSRTLNSFKENVFKDFSGTRLIINIDPVGEDETLGPTLDLIQKFFKEYVLTAPIYPSFPKAFKRLWTKASSPYVFYIEDDWEMLRHVDVSQMCQIMDNHPNLALLRLPLWRCGDTCRQWNRHFPWNGQFYQCPDSLKTSVGFPGTLLCFVWILLKVFYPI